ncbi:DUF1203 domain-containing protein [Sulfitobacter sp. M57]|uniref:DUF1203 domain-containing protein n=1 Tax=unclassified Sulfitobacter TaxID=196795 RepID=UPI0023E2E11F|nr:MULTISPECIES: DUF1203 domain-containing protein [unclassified Sulfitobacter]MDF3415270.1 DUF1203 domain-containing protein [Sulfitobacter sp. KE5]MDF3422751.1 DUF1203 domain-containing protein [Sulfitobacter sp. KE43]MDF3433816.1 DUF1203 domain-containing protein [Sulfitobacter sp. KE42]MDF3459456.1 DUF1203 domain-containing protein [Sulfitobacter sp. S74]MDF3463355.1 DUF1203 domain-containing protein [Sulfitobacter sp. Ks18]
MQFTALPTATIRALQKGACDAYGMACETTISDGTGNPCRHCLREIPAGAAMLILAYRPFDTLHAYAETGPIFLCADICAQGGGDASLPEILTSSPDYLLKGYCAQDRVAYGTGKIVAPDDIPAYVETVFANPKVAYIHVRSARNNCYQLRIDRG